ncbi:MAG: prepilin peptidase [Alphaproteobacteria bacterium]
MTFQFEWLVIAAFAGIVAWAVINDCLAFRIPNVACVALVALYPAWVAVAWPADEPWLQIALHVGVGAGALVVGFVLFMLRAFGAGDAKLLAAIALWAGPALIVDLVLATAIAGGVLSMVIILGRRMADMFALEYRARALAAFFYRGRHTDAATGNDAAAEPAATEASAPRRPATISFERPIPYGIAIGFGAATVAYGLLTTFGAA